MKMAAVAVGLTGAEVGVSLIALPQHGDAAKRLHLTVGFGFREEARAPVRGTRQCECKGVWKGGGGVWVVGRKLLLSSKKKGARWMPRHEQARKGAVSCEKPRGAARRLLIRGYPNGATRLAVRLVTC